jgi:hypothetical protein
MFSIEVAEKKCAIPFWQTYELAYLSSCADELSTVAININSIGKTLRLIAEFIPFLFPFKIDY